MLAKILLGARAEYQKASKPREIEGFLDLYLIRPLGFLLVLALKHTPVTPNQVSIASVFAAMGAAAAYYQGGLGGALVGLGFMVLTSALDSADGQLARAVGRTSALGRTIDGFCDNLSFGAIYLGIWLGYARQGGAHPGLAAILMVVAGISHSTQSALADYARQLYLFHVHGVDTLARERPDLLSASIESAHRAGEGRLAHVLRRAHLGYSRRQRALLASGDRLQCDVERLAPKGSDARESHSRRYREANQRLVGWWWLGAANVHKTGIVAASFVPVLAPEGQLQDLGMLTYFVWDVALNLPVLWLSRTQRAVDRMLHAELHRLSPGGTAHGRAPWPAAAATARNPSA